MSTWSLPARDGIDVTITDADHIVISQPSHIPGEGDSVSAPITLHPEEATTLITFLQQALDELSRRRSE